MGQRVTLALIPNAEAPPCALPSQAGLPTWVWVPRVTLHRSQHPRAEDALRGFPLFVLLELQ